MDICRSEPQSGREAVTEARLRKRGYIPFLEYFLNAKYPKIK